MAGKTWKEISVLLIYIISVVGLITYTDLFGALFQLKGISYTHSGDMVCGTECESYINVTTTYWRVCFEHTNPDQRMYIPGKTKLLKTVYSDYPETVLYKKANYGRTLWVNLNNVDDIITTSPENVPIEWLVPARGKDNWRPIKDGDCWDRGKNNRIKLVGEKAKKESVKWSFKTGEYVDIDPVWIGQNYNSIGQTERKKGYCLENGDITKNKVIINEVS